MKRRKSTQQKKINKTIKIMNIGITLLFISPIFYYCMLQLDTAGSGKSFLELIEQSPSACLTMIYVCLNPFLGYLLQLMKKRIQEVEDVNVVYLNLVIMMLVQILSFNVLYLCFVSFILYRVFDIYQIPFKKVCKGNSISFLFSKVGGSISLLFVHVFLCIINLRIM